MELLSHSILMLEYYLLDWVIFNFFCYLHLLKLILILLFTLYIRSNLLHNMFSYLISLNKLDNSFNFFSILTFNMQSSNLQSNRCLYSQL